MVNAVTIKNMYPLPPMYENIDYPGDATMFSTLDANKGFWKVEVADEDRDETAFASHHRLLCTSHLNGIWTTEHTRNVPNAIDIILSSDKCQLALVYLSAIIIFF